MVRSGIGVATMGGSAVIVLLTTDAPPALSDVGRLDRLHAESQGPLGDMMTGPLCRFDDDGEHVWLDIAVARAAGAAAVGDGAWADRFDGMIAYARSKGWADEAGTHVRAHVERADGSA